MLKKTTLVIGAFLALGTVRCGSGADPDLETGSVRQAATSCTTATQCSDADVCTTDTCDTSGGTPGVCVNTPIPGCGTTSADCNDANACTNDVCNVANRTCVHNAIAGCCNTAAQCND